MNILSEILASKTRRLEAAMRQQSLEGVKLQGIRARKLARPHALTNTLNRVDRINIIAEFKKRSPSKGTIRDDIPAAKMARLYESGGAAAISVLTEEDYFAGSLEDLCSVRKTVSLPILRKDFIFDEYQVYESAAVGADALLLIAAVLDDEVLAGLRRLTEKDLGMDALVEVHTKRELQRAVASGATLIGVNNRDLQTFTVSVATSVKLAPLAPVNAVLVSESGLSPEEVRRLRKIAYKGFLVGESLMRAEAPDRMLRAFLGE